MKTKIVVQPNGDVTIESDSRGGDGERVTTTYFVPSNGGYVRIRDSAGHYPQVCDYLASTGATLHVSKKENLLGVIRREYRRSRA